MTPGILKARGRGMLYDPGRVDEPRFDLLDADRWRREPEAVEAVAGRGAVWFIRRNNEEWAIRHYRRGGLVGNLIEDRYIWLGPEATRPFREFRLLLSLQARGLPAPVPVAAAYQRNGCSYRADLATVRIENAVPLSQHLRSSALSSQRWREIGQVIRRFHNAGIYHADLNAHNILLRNDEGVFLIDFDRGRERSGQGWKKNNLSRLRRSLAKISVEHAGLEAGELQWRDLISGYNAGPGN